MASGWPPPGHRHRAPRCGHRPEGPVQPDRWRGDDEGGEAGTGGLDAQQRPLDLGDHGGAPAVGHAVADHVGRVPHLPGEGGPPGQDVGPSVTGGIDQQVDQVRIPAGQGQGPEHLAGVLRRGLHAEAGDVGAHGGQSCRRHDAVGGRTGVGRLRSGRARGAVGLEPVDVGPVGPGEAPVHRRGQGLLASSLDRHLTVGAVEHGTEVGGPPEDVDPEHVQTGHHRRVVVHVGGGQRGHQSGVGGDGPLHVVADVPHHVGRRIRRGRGLRCGASTATPTPRRPRSTR